MDAGPSYTVLRIKRKRTDQPLSSLVIQDQEDPSYPSSSSAGRPKRARDVSYRPKPRGVFKLADTVPDSWIGRGAEGTVLQERIKGLMDSNMDGEIPVGLVEGKGKGKEKVGEEVQGQVQEEETINEARAVSPTPVADSNSVKADAETTSDPSTAMAMQYRVINSIGLASASLRRRAKGGLGGGPYLPPVVRSYAEVQAEEEAKSIFRFIDAQAISTTSTDPQTQLKSSPDEPQDPQMAAFQNMLDEYLTLERDEASRKAEEEEYVYDLYYRDVRDPSIALGKRAGDGSSATAIGALIGYSDLSPPSTPSSSEPEDEADEDSNDEDYYRNDYPEDEDADEDMEGYDDPFASSGENSESEQEGGRGPPSSNDGDEDEDQQGRGGAGGKWGYRS